MIKLTLTLESEKTENKLQVWLTEEDATEVFWSVCSLLGNSPHRAE